MRMRQNWLLLLGLCLCAGFFLWYGLPSQEQGESERGSQVRLEEATPSQGVVLVGRDPPAGNGPAQEETRPLESSPAADVSGGVLLRAVDVEDGHAIAGARVWPWPDCVTDESGEVRLPPLEDPGDIEFRVECRGYVPAARRLYGQEEIVVALRRGVPLAGRVLEAASRAPIPAATVHLRDRQEAGLLQLERTTGPQGRFEVPGVVAGRLLEIVVEIAGRAPTLTHVLVQEAMAEVEVLVAVGGLLEGRVERPDHTGAVDVEVFLVPPGAPVPPRDARHKGVHSDRAWHIASAPHVRTRDDGSFALAGIPVGEDFVAVAVLGDMWEARSPPFRFTRPGESRLVSLLAEEPAAVSVSLAPDVAKSITLYAVHISGPSMWTREKWGPALAGPCPCGPLSPGAYHVTAYLEGSPDLHREISVGPGERLDLSLTPDTVGSVSGVVVDTEGKPQAEVMLFWRGERSLEGSTASDGRFRFEGVGAEEGELVALKWGAESAEGGLKGVAPGTHGLRVVLKPPANVIVSVEGLPADTRVSVGILTESAINCVAGRVDGDGRLTCPRPGEEAALLVLVAEDRAPVLIDLPASAGGDSERLDPEHHDPEHHDPEHHDPVHLGPVQFDQGIVLEGQVLDRAGDPVAGAEVWIAAWWSQARTKTDAGGRFRFPRLPRRSLLLGFRAAGAAPELRRLEPRSGVILRLSAVAVLEGTVVSQAGAPVVGVRVRLVPVLEVSRVDNPESGALTATTDTRGHFRFAATAGAWRASIGSRGDLLAGPVDVRLSSAEPASIRLVLKPR